MAEAKQIAQVLRAGGVALLPTDTVFGLAAVPSHADAVAKIFSLKRRPAHKNLPIMVYDFAQAVQLGAVANDAVTRLFDSPHCPGALTIVAPVDENNAPDWMHGRREIALRIPDHPLLLEVLALTGPLTMTSANTHGAPTPTNLADACAQLNGAPDLAVDGAVRGDVPSTLVNCCKQPAVIERLGAIGAEDIAKLIEIA